MTDQETQDLIDQAFDHPLGRSLAFSGDQPADRISLRDYVTEVEIGAFQQERGTTQRLRFNVVVEVAQDPGPLEDDVDRILSYDTITEAIDTALAAERLNLLETLADRVAARILAEPLAQRVFLRIEKLDRGPFALGVEIMRGGQPATPTGQPGPGPARAESAARASDQPDPLVVYLSQQAAMGPHLSDWLDRLQEVTRPVILCCGPSAQAAPRADNAMAQRRIDLLAIEQAAWQLAARDPRCVVMASRTELDWAMKHDQIALWAPSKIVLDAVGDRPDAPGDGLALARWLAGQLQASDMLVLGPDLPGGVASGGVAPRVTASDPETARLTLPKGLS